MLNECKKYEQNYNDLFFEGTILYQKLIKNVLFLFIIYVSFY